MSRIRYAALVLTVGAGAFAVLGVDLAIEVGWRGAVAPWTIAAAHVVIALGAAYDRTWARWLGMGLGLFWSAAALMPEVSPIDVAAPHPTLDGEVVRWALVLLHAPLPLLLARPDAAHARTSVSLLVMGVALIPALGLTASGILGLEPRWVPLAFGAVVVLGTIGLARDRTWGLLVIGAAGLALFFSGGDVLGASSGPAGLASDEAPLLGLLLVVAALPFARPIADSLMPRPR
ncbi:MAG: hypothetical protein AB7S26_39465 [Sandaracinaceae bacterium]